MKKHEIYFNEFNLLMGSGGIVYLPLVSGILAACAKTSSVIRKKAQFMDYLFRPDTASNIIKHYAQELSQVAGNEALYEISEAIEQYLWSEKKLFAK